MHIPRLFFTPDDLTGSSGAATSGPGKRSLDLHPGSKVEIVNPAMRNQLVNVLRLTPGNKVVLLNGTGLAFESVLDAASKKSVRLTIVGCEALPECDLRVTVAVSLLKGDRFDWTLQKLTELGVTEIVPLITARTVVKIDSVDAKGLQQKMTRWQAIVRESAEQCERATIPHLVNPQLFDHWITQIAAGGTCDTAFLCAERIKDAHLKDILPALMSRNENFSGTAGKTIRVIVGPEGGFTEEEIATAAKLGIMPVSLGRRILRSETAAIYALAQVVWCLEK
jgi:16S rRNA (uracil1498-N3)-methyltransferase